MPSIHRLASVIATFALLLCLERGAWGAVASDFLVRVLPKAGDADFALPYRWLVPTGYTAATSYPLIIFLHGTGEKGTDNNAQLNNNANGALALVSTANQAAFPCFMMAPQANPSTGWYAKNFDQIIAAVRLEVATYNIDPDRIYVTGLSMGGNGTVALVNHAPYVFACAVPMSGWGDTNFEANCAMPFWVFHAANDGTVGVNGSDNIVSALRNAGRPVIYTRYDTGGHGIWPTAYANPDLLPWMMAQRRNRAVAGTPQVAFTTPATAVGSTSGTTLDIAGTAAIPAGITQVTYTAKSWEAGPGDDLDATKRTVLSGSSSWSQTAASVANGMAMVIAIGPSGSASLGGSTRVSRTLFVNRTSSDQSAGVVTVTSPSATGAATTVAELIALGGTASAGGSKTVSEVTWSSNRGGQGTAISTGYGSASLSWSITDLGLVPGVNIITLTIRDSLGTLTSTTYTVTMSGTPVAELDVTRGVIAIADGGSDTLSGTAAGSGTSLTYTFTNSGSVSLGITTPVSISGMSNCAVVVGTQPGASVAAGATTSLVLTVTPTAVGAWSFAVSATNTDATESPYDWTVGGTAAAVVVPAPELDVSRGATAVADGGTGVISGTTAGSGVSLIYTFTNSGTSSLGISAPVSIVGATNCAVVVTTQPATSVAAGASTSLVLTLTPTAAGAWSFGVSVANTDANESPYNWTVTGTASAAATTPPSSSGTPTAGSRPRGDTQAGDGGGGCGLGSGLGLILTAAALGLRQLRGRR